MSRPLYPVRHVCYVKMAEARSNWLWDKRREGQFHDGSFERWNDERTEQFPFAHRDGVTIYVSPVDPDPTSDWLRGQTQSSGRQDGVPDEEGDHRKHDDDDAVVAPLGE